MSLIVIRTPHVAPSEIRSVAKVEAVFSYELGERLMAVAGSDRPTRILRWMETHFVVVPPDCTHELARELRDLRAIAIDSRLRHQDDGGRLVASFDALLAFVTEAMTLSEYVLLSAGVVPTDFVLSDTGVLQ